MNLVNGGRSANIGGSRLFGSFGGRPSSRLVVDMLGLASRAVKASKWRQAAIQSESGVVTGGILCHH